MSRDRSGASPGDQSVDLADPPPEVRADDRSGETLGVATYNVRYAGIDEAELAWTQRRDGVVKAIDQANPDILATQEVWLEQLPDLQERLEYEWVAFPDASGPHTPIAYRPERLVVTDEGSFGVAPDGKRGVIAWDAQFQRTVTHATFQDTQTGQTVTVFSVHLDHSGSTARLNGAHLLTDRIPDGPCVLAGDYNCEPGSDPYEQLTTTLNDTRKTATHREGPQETYAGFDTGDDGNKTDTDGDSSRVSNETNSYQLDHVFTRGFSVVRHRVYTPDTLASDHRLVMADVIAE